MATEPTPPVRSLRADVPPNLERAILRCLEKAREQRYQSVGELAAALVEFGSKRAHGSLERIQGTLQPGLGRTELATSPAISPTSSTAASWQTGPGTKGTGKAVAAIAGAAAVAGLVVVGVLLARKSLAPAVAPGLGSGAGAVLVAPASSAVAPPAASNTADPIAAASTTAPVASATSTMPAAPAPVPSTRTQRTPGTQLTQRPGASAATAPAAKVHCDPPYYFDAQGNRVFKKECL